jgi:hypothetical protein
MIGLLGDLTMRAVAPAEAWFALELLGPIGSCCRTRSPTP